MTPIRSSSCSTHFHQATQTDSVLSEESRSPIIGIPRRYSPHGIFEKSFEGAPCTYDEPSEKSRIPTEFQEMHHRAITNNGILWIYDQLDGDDVIAPGSKSIQDSEGVSACSQSAFHYREATSSSDRASLRMYSCYFGGPPALQSSTAIETSGSGAKRKPLRSLDSDVTGSTAGAMVADPQSLNQSFPSNTEAVSCSHPGDGWRRMPPPSVGGPTVESQT
jgi:hypothetical protein